MIYYKLALEFKKYMGHLTHCDIAGLLGKNDDFGDNHAVCILVGGETHIADLIRLKAQGEYTLSYNTSINQLNFGMFCALIVFNYVLGFTMTYIALCYMCMANVECYAYISPIILIFWFIVLPFSTHYYFQMNWLTQWIYSIENQCVFITKKTQSTNKCIIELSPSLKTKQYDMNPKSVSISLLLCKYRNKSCINIACFHLPAEIHLHQAIVCDVNDVLSNPKHSGLGLMVVFYKDTFSKDALSFENFFKFLEKSNFIIVDHQLDFAITALKKTIIFLEENSMVSKDPLGHLCIQTSINATAVTSRKHVHKPFPNQS